MTKILQPAFSAVSAQDDNLRVNLTQEMLEAILNDAILAPSGDNAQPWRFEWDGRTLNIHHLDAIARHSLNPANQASFISLGCLLEALRLSATQHGFITKVALTLDNPSSAIWAKVTFLLNDSAPDPLALMIPHRTTDRRNYLGGEIDAQLSNRLMEFQHEFTGCGVFIQHRISPDFMDHFLNCERAFWTRKSFMRDLTRWIRLSPHEASASPDGMSWRNLYLSYVEVLLFRAIRRIPSLPKWLWSIGFGPMIRHRTKVALNSSAALICFSTKSVDSQSLCKVGAMAYRSWLELNAHGFGVQPLSFSSLYLSKFHTSISGAPDSDTNLELFAAGTVAFKKFFNLGDGDQAIWMFRVGKSPALPPENRTQRHSLKSLMIPPPKQTK